MEPTHWQLELTQADMEMAADEREQAIKDICHWIRRHDIRLQELIARLLDEGEGAQSPSTGTRNDSGEAGAGPAPDIHCSLLAHVAFAPKLLRVTGRSPMAEAINDR